MESATSPPARIEFYDGEPFAGDPLVVALTLIARAAASGQRCLVLAFDDAQAGQLDRRLWEVEPSLFVPHARAGDIDHVVATALIIGPGETAAPRPLIVNLRPEPVSAPCDRIVEVIPADDAGRQAARERWRHYQASNAKPVKLDLQVG